MPRRNLPPRRAVSSRSPVPPNSPVPAKPRPARSPRSIRTRARVTRPMTRRKRRGSRSPPRRPRATLPPPPAQRNPPPPRAAAVCTSPGTTPSTPPTRTTMRGAWANWTRWDTCQLACNTFDRSLICMTQSPHLKSTTLVYYFLGFIRKAIHALWSIRAIDFFSVLVLRADFSNIQYWLLLGHP